MADEEKSSTGHKIGTLAVGALGMTAGSASGFAASVHADNKKYKLTSLTPEELKEGPQKLEILQMIC